VCGSGAGVSVAAGKIRGIRAATIHDAYTARQGVEHDAVNVLCIGGRVIGSEVAAQIVAEFLDATVSGEERHVRRRAKVEEIERTMGEGG
jgi:ribose 5-phosphate isomerase B